MNASRICLLAGLSTLLTGCGPTRSISNSGYQQESWRSGYVACRPRSDQAFAYRGELSEFDVLGIDRGEVTTESEIRRTLDNSKKVSLREGDSILLIQSGATIPDGPMMTELGKYFSVVPFSGMPPRPPATSGRFETDTFDAESYAKALRLAAARGGNDTIVCYWGFLESENDSLPTKTVSWVPVVNWVVPDEKQHMRIRLKMALIDVRTGNWTVFSPKPFETSRISTSPRRGTADQKQVERLKLEAYTACASDLVKRFANGIPETANLSPTASPVKAGSSSTPR
jgi:hypothetical protein